MILIPDTLFHSVIYDNPDIFLVPQNGVPEESGGQRLRQAGVQHVLCRKGMPLEKCLRPDWSFCSQCLENSVT